MKRTILLAAALSAAFHVGVMFGFNDRESSSNPQNVNLDDPIVNLEKETPITPVKGVVEDPITPNVDSDSGLAKPDTGLVERSVTCIPDAITMQVYPNPDYVYDPTKMQKSIPINSDGKSKGGIKDTVVVDVASLDRVPKPIKTVNPIYPPSMRSSNVEGTVELMIVVAPNGRVVDARVIQATSPEFADSALKAVTKWKFEKGIKNGMEVSFRCNLPIHFDAPR